MDEDDDFSNIIPFTGTTNPMSEALDLAPIPREVKIVKEREDGDDYKTARGEIHDAMGVLKTAMHELAEHANQSQNARSYEVLGQLADKLILASEKLVDLKPIEAPAGTPGAGGTLINNNTLFISSADMLDMIRNEANKVVIDHDDTDD